MAGKLDFDAVTGADWSQKFRRPDMAGRQAHAESGLDRVQRYVEQYGAGNDRISGKMPDRCRMIGRENPLGRRQALPRFSRKLVERLAGQLAGSVARQGLD